jgi:ABC-type dipeptide/oligopeptide/nickel transport system ATPase subunit
MLSIRKTKDSLPIAINDKSAKLVYLNSDFDLEKNQIDEDNLSILPRTDSQREVIYICGPSGVGKSTICKKYIEFYQQINKKSDVYIFSKVQDDKTLKSLKKVYRIPIDQDLVENPIDVQNELKDCLVLMDDVDQVGDKDLEKAITNLMTELLETGRHNSFDNK